MTKKLMSEMSKGERRLKRANSKLIDYKHLKLKRDKLDKLIKKAKDQILDELGAIPQNEYPALEAQTNAVILQL